MAISQEEFDAMVVRAVDGIPEKFRARIKNVAILIEQEPSAALRRQQKLGSGQTLLGFYHGVPATVRGDAYGVGATMPDTITLFQGPIEAAAHGEPAQIEKVIADTIWHEYAHYFGMDDHEIAEREKRT
jgi:predicted Zn-dependent protease with MMP-like domain